MEDTVFDDVPVRIYRPHDAVKDNGPGVLFYHGGGWVFGSKGIITQLVTKRWPGRHLLFRCWPSVSETILGKCLVFTGSGQTYNVKITSQRRDRFLIRGQTILMSIVDLRVVRVFFEWPYIHNIGTLYSNESKRAKS